MELNISDGIGRGAGALRGRCPPACPTDPESRLALRAITSSISTFALMFISMCLRMVVRDALEKKTIQHVYDYVVSPYILQVLAVFNVGNPFTACFTQQRH